MTFKRSPAICSILLLLCFKTEAQYNQVKPDSLHNANESRLAERPELSGNLTLFNHFAAAYLVQYERPIAKHTSFSLVFRWTPGNQLPIKNLTVSTAGQNDPNIIRTIECLRMRHSAITPELRFYTSKKGYGRGFYIAPFYRYARFTTNDITVHFGAAKTDENAIRLAGKLATGTAGIKLGAQWIVRKKISVDWWLLGPHYGTGTGVFSGFASKPLSLSDQENIRTELRNLDIPLTKKVLDVNAQGGSIQLKGLWAGIRGGVAIGLRS